MATGPQQEQTKNINNNNNKNSNLKEIHVTGILWTCKYMYRTQQFVTAHRVYFYWMLNYKTCRGPESWSEKQNQELQCLQFVRRQAQANR